MTHGAEEQLESAEHAEHARHDPFTSRVAMSMAIMAALLACVTMLSHQAHNETLSLQIEATRIESEANILHTKATDKWGEFQANNIREHEYETFRAMFPLLSKDPAKTKEAEALVGDWSSKIDTYQGKLDKLKEEATGLADKAEEGQKRAQEKMEESEKYHHQGNRFDLAELGAEIALVLCSVAVLTKNKHFWLGGVAVGILGVIVLISGFMLS